MKIAHMGMCFIYPCVYIMFVTTGLRVMEELLKVNQQEARVMLSHCQGFSDEQLQTMLLDAFEEIGMPREFPPDVDTSREGLLDLLAGLTAIACGTPVEQG